MKKSIILLWLIFIMLLGCKKQQIELLDDEEITNILNIYAYQSFEANGLSQHIIDEFEKLHDCKVNFRFIPYSESLIKTLTDERSNPSADIAMGIKNTQVFRVYDADIFQSYDSFNSINISSRTLHVDRRNILIPYAYSYFAFVYDSQVVSEPPRTLAMLQSSYWKNRLLIPDPYNTSYGHVLILYSLHLWGERGFETFWGRLRNNIYIGPTQTNTLINWGDAITDFQTGATSIMFANTTYPAYFSEVDFTDRFRAVIPAEGGIRDIEYAAIVRGAKNLYLARRFIDFMLTHDFQKHVPTTLWMYPVIANVPQPRSFYDAPIPRDDITDLIFDRRDNFHNRWIVLWDDVVNNRNNDRSMRSFPDPFDVEHSDNPPPPVDDDGGAEGIVMIFEDD
jgi:thiamine transport system substrate-binding protein